MTKGIRPLVDSFSQSAVLEENGGEVIINQGYAYTAATTPAVASNYVLHSFLDSARNLLYVGTWGGGLSVINLDEHYNSLGIFVSQPVSLSSVHHNSVFWEENKTNGQNISVQTRTGDENAFWIDNFDDEDTSEYLGDYYEWDSPDFQEVKESGGILKLSDLDDPDAGWTAFWLDTGKPDNYFPAGSLIRARIRVNTQAEGYVDWMFTDDWEDGDASYSTTNEWINLKLVSDEPFSKIGFEPCWNSGWTSEDSFEIDWLSIELPDSYWGEWNEACANQYGCEIGDTAGASWLQYRVNLTTDDTTSSPSVNSVTLASGYQSSGSFTSSVLDAGDTADWTSLEKEETLPAGTSITFETRSGDTPAPDQSWEDWKNTNGSQIASRDARYIQYKATLVTTDQNQTPVLKALTLNYERSNFSPVIAIGKNKTLFLDANTTVALKTSSLVFTAAPQNTSAKYVQIWKNRKLFAEKPLRKKNRFRSRVSPQKNEIHAYQFRYLDKDKNEVLLSPEYRILLDARKPVFTRENKKTFTASPGDTITWQATDNDQVKYYEYTFQGKARKTNDNFFILPADLKPGRTWNLNVTAFDRAENQRTLKMKVKVGE